MDESLYKTKRISDVDRSPWHSFVVFFQIAGKWWFSVWVLVVLAGLVALSLTIAGVEKLPVSIWVSLLVLGLVLAPAVAFHFLRIERDTFNALWDDKDTIISALALIEGLRAKGAPLLKRGMNLDSAEAVPPWIKKVNDWTKRTIKTVRLLHPAEAGNVETLGFYRTDLPSGAYLGPDHSLTLHCLARRMEILSEIRDRWTTRTF
jgi:hypothetical protein